MVSFDRINVYIHSYADKGLVSVTEFVVGESDFFAELSFSDLSETFISKRYINKYEALFARR